MKFYSMLALFILLTNATVFAGQPIEEFFQTANKFKQLISDKAAEGQIPRASDPNVMSMLEILSDKNKHFSSKVYTVKDLDLLMKMTEGLNSIIMSYALYDLQKEIDIKDTPDIRAQKAYNLMERNSVLYQDEIFKLHPFHLRCMAKQIPLITEFVLSLKPEELTDIRLNGLKKVQQGMFGAYVGALSGIYNSKIKYEYRSKLLQTMSELSTVFAQILPISYRIQIINLLKQIQPLSSPDLNPYFQNIENEMSSKKCDGLCSL